MGARRRGRAALRELTRAALDAAGFHAVVARDRFHAARLAERFRDRLRAAVVGGDPDLVGVAAELRRFHPVLPVVATAAVPDPGEVLAAVAEAVAEAIRTDAGLLG